MLVLKVVLPNYIKVFRGNWCNKMSVLLGSVADNSRLVSAWSGPAVNTTGLTMCAWVRPGTISGGRTVFCLEPNLYLGISWADGISPNFATTNTTRGYNTSPFVTNKWDHWACVLRFISGTTFEKCLYKNSKRIVSTTTTDTMTAAFSQITIGNRQMGSAYTAPWSGYVADVRLWNRVLSCAQIRREMMSSIPHPANLIFSAPFLTSLTCDTSGQHHMLASTGTTILTSFNPPYVSNRLTVRQRIGRGAGR
jgi:hypothetical protein